MRSSTRSILLVTLLSLPVAGGSTSARSGEEPAKPPAPDAAPEQAPEEVLALRPSAIPSAAAALEERLAGQAEEARATNRELLGIEQALAPERDSLVARQESVSATDPNRASGRAVQRYRLEAGEARDRLQRWEARLAGRGAELEAQREWLLGQRDLWERTRAALVDPLVAPLLATAAAIQGPIETGLSAIEEQLDRLYRQQLEVAEARELADSLYRDLAALEAASRRGLLRRDVAPLWEAVAKGGIDRPGRLDLRQSLAEEWSDVVQHLQRLRHRLWVWGAGTGACLLLLTALRRRPQLWTPDDAALARFRHAIDRPYTVSLFLALIAWRLSSITAPPLLEDVLRAAAGVCLFRILPGLIPEALRTPARALSLLYALEALEPLNPSTRIDHRGVLLVQALVAFSVWAWIMRGTARARMREAGAWMWLLIPTGRLTQIVLLAAIVSGVLGNSTLSEFLYGGPVRIWFLGMGLTAGALVLEGLLGAVLRLPVARLLGVVRQFEGSIRGRFAVLIRLAAFIIWVFGALLLLGVAIPVGEAIQVAWRAEWAIGTLAISLGSVLTFALAVFLAVFVSRAFRRVLAADVLPRLGLPRGAPEAISVISHYVILTVGFLLALAAAGIEVGKFAILLGGLGVGVGLGLQGLVSNVVAGLMLLFERPFHVGDSIEIDGAGGEVRAIGMRATTIRTLDGAEVVVPNGVLFSNKLVNWTLSDRTRRIEIKVGVAYGSEPARVIEILRAAADGHPAVLKSPEPAVLFAGFGESALDFSVRFWTADFNAALLVRSDVLAAVHKGLNEAGIVIPFPQRDVHLHPAGPPAHPSGA